MALTTTVAADPRTTTGSTQPGSTRSLGIMTAISPRPDWQRSGRCWTRRTNWTAGRKIRPIPVVEGYGAWEEAYDQPGNQLIDLEQPIVWEILDGLPRGIALDAACGTGRPAEYLARLGRTVIGVDSSPRMLAVAFAPARALRSPAARARKLVKSTGRGEHLVDRPRDRLTRA